MFQIIKFQKVFTIDDGLLPHLVHKKPDQNENAVNKDGVHNLLKNTYPRKAAGPDRLSNYILKQLAAPLFPIVTKSTQHSNNTSSVPLERRQASICPIFKNGKTTSPSISAHSTDHCARQANRAHNHQAFLKLP